MATGEAMWAGQLNDDRQLFDNLHPQHEGQQGMAKRIQGYLICHHCHTPSQPNPPAAIGLRLPPQEGTARYPAHTQGTFVIKFVDLALKQRSKSVEVSREICSLSSAVKVAVCEDLHGKRQHLAEHNSMISTWICAYLRFADWVLAP